MNNQMLFGVAGLAAGLLAGLTLTRVGEKLSAWKCKKKNREFKEDPRFVSLWATLLCALVNAIGWGACMYVGWQVPVPAVLACIVLSLGIELILMDLRLRLIPNEILLWMLIVGVPMELMVNGLASIVPCILTTMIVFGVMSTLGQFMGYHKIGAGDAKLAMVMSMTLGFRAMLIGLFGMSLLLLAFCIVGMMMKKLTLKSYLPLGPFMVPGYWLGMLVLLSSAVI